MEDNKLRTAIEYLFHEVGHKPVQIDKLYSLIEDVVVAFNEYDFTQYIAYLNESEDCNDEYYQITTQSGRFQYFIQHIYKPK